MIKPPRLDSLQLKIEQKERSLKLVNKAIESATVQLDDLLSDIRKAQVDHDREVAAIKRSLRIKLRKLYQSYDSSVQELYDREQKLKTSVESLTVRQGQLLFEIGEEQDKIARLQAEYRGVREENTAKLIKLQERMEFREGRLTALKAELDTLLGKTERAQAQLDRINKLLAAGEAAYAKRSSELQSAIKTAESELSKVERLIREYNASIEAVRAADEARARDLDQREAKLVALRRALTQDRQNLEDEKKQFYQTKAL